MKKYVCDICGYTYDEALGDPDNGIAPGTKFEDLPDDFVCPLCGVGKDSFSAEQFCKVMRGATLFRQKGLSPRAPFSKNFYNYYYKITAQI